MNHALPPILLASALLGLAGCNADKDGGGTEVGTPTGTTPTDPGTGATAGGTPTGTGSGTGTGTGGGTTATGTGVDGGTGTGTGAGSGTGTGAGTGTGTGGTTAAGLWYFNCGDPVCSGYGGPFAGVPLCSNLGINAGDPCGAGTLGQACDPVDFCNRLVVCAASDPTAQPGGCPISLSEHKREIAYLTDADRKRFSEQLLATRLATWQYKGDLDDGRTHLGFLIDDAPDSAAVRPDGGHVDLYGYTSLTVAALQQQQRELEALRAEVEALKLRCGTP